MSQGNSTSFIASVRTSLAIAGQGFFLQESIFTGTSPHSSYEYFRLTLDTLVNLIATRGRLKGCD